MNPPSKKVNSINILSILLLLFLLSLFFPVRHVFLTKEAYLTGQYSDFTSISSYLSDILLFITFIWILLPRGDGKSHVVEFYHVVKYPIFLLIWAFFSFFLNFDKNWPLNLFFLVKPAEMIVAYGTASIIFSKTSIKTAFLWIFIILSSIQSILALTQFYLEHSIGLFKIGEPHLSALSYGIAKIVSSGTTYIRGYGTFPHPNPLSAFLIVGIFFALHLFGQSTKLWQKVLLGGALILNIFGLTVSFSRAAFAAFALGLIIYFGYQVYKKIWGHNQTIVFILVLATLLASFGIFHKFLLTRVTITDQATVERGVYNQIGLRMVESHPVFGFGTGESLLHMQHYSNSKLQPWDIQPIHNYFVLAATELGIPGALFLIWFFISHFWRLAKTAFHEKLSTFPIVLVTILFCFLFLMFFDHYFYTLEQTQLLLWLILGLIAAEIKTKKPLQTSERS